MTRLIVALLCAASLAPASAALAQPRPAGLRPALNTDEGGLWAEFDKAERSVSGSAQLDTDPALNKMVRDVSCRLAPEYCDELRIYILDRGDFNATVAANGWVEVWSGLLLRAETEDELAYVLGHEISHFAENHSIKDWRNKKSQSNALMVLQIGVALGGAAAGVSTGTASGANDAAHIASSINDLLYLATVAGFFRYSRADESEADELGLRRSAGHGYEPAAAARIWRNLSDEVNASDYPKVRAAEARASLFATHPVTAERIAAMDTLAKLFSPKPGGDRHAYRAVIRPHLAAWLKDDMKRRDAGQSLQLIGRLSGLGEDLGVLNFYKGEAYRLRRKDGDLDKAKRAYLIAAAYSDAPLATWRNLGDLNLQTGDAAGARSAYQTYLARAPDAQDRWLVEASLNKAMGTGT